MPLTDAKIRKLKPARTPTRHADGEGLGILLTPNGSRLWRFRYRFDGKQKDMAFGKYPAVSLALARERRAEAKALLASGIDPNVAKAEEKARKRALQADTFEQIASELLDKHRAEGMSEGKRMGEVAGSVRVFPEKPRHMHWRTYRKLEADFYDGEEAFYQAHK